MKIREITCNDLSDNFFFENGYWESRIETSCSSRYKITVPTEKWRKLFDTCMAKLKPNQIITPELLVEVINSRKTQRTKRKSHSGYIKKKDRV
jgi:hypothetical protein